MNCPTLLNKSVLCRSRSPHFEDLIWRSPTPPIAGHKSLRSQSPQPLNQGPGVLSGTVAGWQAKKRGSGVTLTFLPLIPGNRITCQKQRYPSRLHDQLDGHSKRSLLANSTISAYLVLRGFRSKLLFIRFKVPLKFI